MIKPQSDVRDSGKHLISSVVLRPVVDTRTDCKVDTSLPGFDRVSKTQKSVGHQTNTQSDRVDENCLTSSESSRESHQQFGRYWEARRGELESFCPVIKTWSEQANAKDSHVQFDSRSRGVT